MQMLKECRCGSCKRLLARVGVFTKLEIKCPRCGTLNHLKTESLDLTPLSAPKPANADLITA
nr:Com family DNA-binding transcriptional regulator [Pseudomonas sp.]